MPNAAKSVVWLDFEASKVQRWARKLHPRNHARLTLREVEERGRGLHAGGTVWLQLYTPHTVRVWTMLPKGHCDRCSERTIDETIRGSTTLRAEVLWKVGGIQIAVGIVGWFIDPSRARSVFPHKAKDQIGLAKFATFFCATSVKRRKSPD